MDISKDIIFKGGTSLSKCYGLINRFSEDIDLTIDKSIFSFEGSQETTLSGKEFQKRLKSNNEKAISFVNHQFRSMLENLVRGSLPAQSVWQISPEENEPKNLRFYYPTAVKVNDDTYIKQSVLIEIGVRGDVFPCENKTVKSYVEKQFEDLLIADSVMIKTLVPTRTFWEKITLLHAENNRSDNKDFSDRLSRHYYDIHQMIQFGVSENALGDLPLLHDVIENKKRYFKASWAKYDEAVPGKLKIFPNARLLPYLEIDYKNMGSMIFGEVPEFSEIIQSIKEFEILFNRASSVI